MIGAAVYARVPDVEYEPVRRPADGAKAESCDRGAHSDRLFVLPGRVENRGVGGLQDEQDAVSADVRTACEVAQRGDRKIGRDLAGGMPAHPVSDREDGW